MSVAHPSELTLAMHADGELPAAQAAATELHVAACMVCHDAIDALRAEAQVLSKALAAATATVVIPEFNRPISVSAFVALSAAMAVLAVLVSVVPAVVDYLLPAPLTWLTPRGALRLVDLTVSGAIYLVRNGELVMTSILEIVAVTMALGLVAWLALARKRASAPLIVAVMTCAMLLQPMSAHALEVRG